MLIPSVSTGWLIDLKFIIIPQTFHVLLLVVINSILFILGLIHSDKFVLLYYYCFNIVLLLCCKLPCSGTRLHLPLVAVCNSACTAESAGVSRSGGEAGKSASCCCCYYYYYYY